MSTDEVLTLLNNGDVETAFGALKKMRETLDPVDRESLDGAFLDAIWSHVSWRDPALAAESLLFARDLAFERDVADGDTNTRFLIRAVAQKPDDDLVLAYADAVYDEGYAYTDLSLLDIAKKLDDNQRAQRLASVHTLCEFTILNPVHLEWEKDTMKHAFAGARSLGVDRTAWSDSVAWLKENITFTDIPDDLWERFVAD